MVNEKILKIDNLNVSFGKKKILNSINLEFEKGKLYGIIGPNGAGKSTLLSAITKLIDLDNGEISLKNKKVSDFSIKELAKNISLMTQNFNIKFPYTTKQIVSMGRYPYNDGISNEEDLNIIDRAMRDANVKEFQNRQITELSGGERQRVHFAKTLCQDTEIVLIDEGVSNADIYYQINFIKLLKEKAVQDKKLIILIIHDLSLARKYCDELLILKDGKVYKFGKSEEVLNEQTLFDVFNVKGSFINNSLHID